jgi:hypothetical protein
VAHYKSRKDMMLFEIRNYYKDPAYQEAYKAWVQREALPYLAQRLDVVGFWVTTDDPPEIDGEPMDKLGAANVTWIIRWRDLAQRNDATCCLASFLALCGTTSGRACRVERPAICGSR